jgi:hypothetical protein
MIETEYTTTVTVSSVKEQEPLDLDMINKLSQRLKEEIYQISYMGIYNYCLQDLEQSHNDYHNITWNILFNNRNTFMPCVLYDFDNTEINNTEVNNEDRGGLKYL